MIVVTKKKLRKFENEMTLWNFQRALNTIKDVKDFPQNAYYLISSLMNNYGDCGSQRSGYAYRTVSNSVNTIMQITSPWIESHRNGGKAKPKAIAV